MWYTDRFSTRLEREDEFDRIKSGLLSGTKSSSSELLELISGISYRYFVTRNRGEYVLDLNFNGDEARIEIASTDRKTLEDEIQRARAIVDNTFRVERNRRLMKVV